MRRGSLWLVALVLASCGRRIELGSDLSEAEGGSASDGGTRPCVVTRCENKIYACGDCVDNDGDSLVDEADPECLGACDDTEESFYSGIFGQSDGACKIDCYFDGDNGSGNDDCQWSQRCDPLSQSPAYYPSGSDQCTYDPLASIPGTARTCDELASAQSETCLSTCLPLTPKGCDCFGCCELPIGSGRMIWLGSMSNGIGTCNMARLADPAQCHPCTPIVSCSN
jgi:hypothetical protein